MTKRPSPFETNICRQSKIHINNLENDLKALKNVEEQTLKKLMEGSKKSHMIVLNAKDFNSEADVQDKNCNFKQKSVTDYFTINGMKKNQNGKIHISSTESPSKCSFCESNTTSLHQCVQCDEYYCFACSFAVYESSDDKRVCLSCS